MTHPGGLRFDRYTSDGKDEWLMRIGEEGAPPILFVPPLFEEMNRTRALIASVMRKTSAKGFDCWLPDLPGTGESERALADCGWEDWLEAVRSASNCVLTIAHQAPVIASLRGGSLLDHAAVGTAWWRFAPVEGRSLARDLARSALAGGIDWAGYDASSAMREALETAVAQPVSPLRTVRLGGGTGQVDAEMTGPSLWRRSEPGNSIELAEAMAADLSEWSRQCAAC